LTQSAPARAASTGVWTSDGARPDASFLNSAFPRAPSTCIEIGRLGRSRAVALRRLTTTAAPFSSCTTDADITFTAALCFPTVTPCCWNALRPFLASSLLFDCVD
jgi:hypothetical protein